MTGNWNERDSRNEPVETAAAAAASDAGNAADMTEAADAPLLSRIAELEAEVERLRRENTALRKRAASTAGRGHMSTKLTEALRE